jgi:hypothetical protein
MSFIPIFSGDNCHGRTCGGMTRLDQALIFAQFTLSAIVICVFSPLTA